jgi:glycosyltransferase involved in cell wall biosynthesis
MARPKALYLRPKASGLIVPELFSPAVAAALPRLFAACLGPRVAVFHDAIPLQYPELTPKATVARFPSYLRELLAFDGVAAVSEDSRRALGDFWRWLGVKRTPALAAIPLGLEPAPKAAESTRAASLPTVLCVGSIEARKNHLALLDAYDRLWLQGARFNLELVGLANRETGAAARHRVESLRSAGRLVRYRGPLGDAELEEAYQQCLFTVYPSIAEGFGLPVAESLARGKACLCRMTGALGEVASGGGCLDLGSAGPDKIAAAIQRLLDSPAERDALEAAARGRRFKTWKDYSRELSAWMWTLRRDT